MPDELAQRVIRVIATSQRIPWDSIHAGSSFEELKIDSLAGIEILFALESEFDVDIPDEAARTIKSVQEMIDGVAQLLEAKQQKAVEQ